MAESRTSSEIFWVNPEQRGILPIKGLHVPQRLRKTLRQSPYKVRTDCNFSSVIDFCAHRRLNGEDTWINPTIRDLFVALHETGFAHSIECYDRDTEQLAGGLYGLAIGGAFFGESMFSRQRDSSKIALVHLVARLYWSGFELLDTQFYTPHLGQFGAEEILREDYLKRLHKALNLRPDFRHPTIPAVMAAPGAGPEPHSAPEPSEEELVTSFLQSITQTS